MQADMEADMGADRLKLYGVEFSSRLCVGTAQYPSPAILARAIEVAKVEIVTVSLRRESGGSRAGERFWSLIRELGVRVLPNTAGCRSVKEAVTTAQMAREVFDTPWIKLEVIGEEDTLQPDVFGLVEAASILTREGFQVFPYTTEDLVAAEKLLASGCEVLMPWGSPIGSGRGLNNPYALKSLRAHFPNVPLIIDAGNRRALACGGGDGNGFRCGALEHGDRQGRRSHKNGSRLCARGRGRADRVSRRFDARAGHGGTLDPGDRTRFRRSRSCLIHSI